MRFIFPWLFLLIIACTPVQESDNIPIVNETSHNDRSRNGDSDSALNNSKETLELDTILERNNPKNLDLHQHQLFIDTTRSSIYYDQIMDWTPNRSDLGGIDYYLGQIALHDKLNHVNLDRFPKKWISIHKLKDQFYAYNPINGVDWRITLTDSSVNEYAMESYADAISKLVSISKNELVLKVRSYYNQHSFPLSYLQIKKSKMPHIYTLVYSNDLTFAQDAYVRLITPLEYLKEFDLIVNDAPYLVYSTIEFDRITLEDLE